MSGMTRVLVVDDEPAILKSVVAGLEARDYEVRVAIDGQSAIDAIAGDPAPDLVVLDLGLPDIDGVDVVRRTREWSSVAIIILTAEHHEDRKVEALDAGADDYVTKPFSMPELLARVRVAERHRVGVVEVTPDQSVYEVGDLRMDVARHKCWLGDREIDLTPKEFGFLAILCRWPGRVLTHRMILQHVWGPDYGTETQYLRTYATNIRKKLQDPEGVDRLVAKPGVGYCLLDPAPDPTPDRTPDATA